MRELLIEAKTALLGLLEQAKQTLLGLLQRAGLVATPKTAKRCCHGKKPCKCAKKARKGSKR
jgi:hypothetical protein